LGLSISKIVPEAKVEMKRIIRALNTTRDGLRRDITEVFEGDAEGMRLILLVNRRIIDSRREVKE